MSNTATATDWSSRAVPQALSPVRLAALVDRSIARTEGLLFTATPAEELDEIGRWQQLKDQAFAGQVRAIVAAWNRAGRDEREFAGDEVGLAIGATSTTGSNLVAEALSITALPGLLEAVEAGLLTERHVHAVMRELDKVELTIEQRHAVVLVMLARYTGQAPGELARLVARLIVQVDRAAAAARDRLAASGRNVRFTPDVDGQSLLIARGPSGQIAAIRAALEATLPDTPEVEDDRSRGAREFDLFVDLLTGGAQAGSWHAEIVVPVSTATGGDLELADIPGLGPILPSTARDLLGHAETLAPTAVDQTGQVIATGDPVRVQHRTTTENATATEVTNPLPAGTLPTDPVPGDPLPADPVHAALLAMRVHPPDSLTGSGYRFPPRLRRFLQARDRTCVFPGCGRPAARTDKDHRDPWPAGATSAHNGQCLCRHHHRAKHTVFTVTRTLDGTYEWTTRGGWRFHRRPKGF